jgi:hypothetical protein
LHSNWAPCAYAAFFCSARIFAHRARCAAAIFFRAAADMLCLDEAEFAIFIAVTAGFDSFRTLAHLAFCACAIFRRDAADMIRFGWVAFPVLPLPFNDSITEIA